MDEFASEAYYGRRELRRIQEVGRLAPVEIEIEIELMMLLQ
jgi:hypothetical protein